LYCCVSDRLTLKELVTLKVRSHSTSEGEHAGSKSQVGARFERSLSSALGLVGWSGSRACGPVEWLGATSVGQ